MDPAEHVEQQGETEHRERTTAQGQPTRPYARGNP